MSLIYEGEGLRKFYDGRLVLDIPSFKLEKGEALVIEGANGAGKSTFLRLLAFLETPDAGRLRLFAPGEPRRACSLLLQEPWLLRDSVYRNVTLGLRLRGERANLRDKYAAAMAAAGFANPEDFAKRPSSALSGGEKQRVALASRLIFAPAVLLLDEPTAYVDAESARHIVAALVKARAAGSAVVCATHDKNLAEALGAKITRLNAPNSRLF